MTDWIAVGNGQGVERSVVTAGTPAVVFLDAELGFGDSEPGPGQVNGIGR
jgi:hypothetical protein